MADISSGCTITEVTPALGVKLLKVETANTVDAGDHFHVTLADYGIATLEAIIGMIHTTEDSVIATEADTTSVTSGVLTVTIAAGSDDCKRVVILVGDSH